jgi:hypothetical protein
MDVKAIDGSALSRKLLANKRSAVIPEDKDVYGWLIGSWDLDIEFYGMNVSKFGWKGEAHFAWILEGLAMQDTWTLPRPGAKNDPQNMTKTTGTSLRVWSAAKEAWLVTWINPSSGVRDELVGTRVGDDIVQLGHHGDGSLIRWSFREITKHSFHWFGEVLESDGKTWRLEAAFLARRRTQQ